MASPVLLTSGEVAEALGVTATTVHRWVKIGRIRPARTAGHAWLFTAAEVARVAALPKLTRGRPRHPRHDVELPEASS